MRPFYEIHWSQSATTLLLSLSCATEQRLRTRVRELADAAARAHPHVSLRPQRIRLTADALWLDCVLVPEQRNVTVYASNVMTDLPMARDGSLEQRV